MVDDIVGFAALFHHVPLSRMGRNNMALVIIGGLTTSMLLNLLVMPVIYWKFGKTKRSDII